MMENKLNMENTAYTIPFNLEFECNLPALKNVKKLKFKKNWAQLRQNFVCSDNPGQNN